MQVSYWYRARRSDCQGCPVRSQCCPGNRVVGRSVHRSEELAEVTEFRHKMQSERAREIYRRRAQGGDGGVLGLSDLQHLCVDASALETSRSGGDSRIRKGEIRSCKGEIGELEPSISSSSRWH